MNWLMAKQWSPYIVGMGIGILSWFTLLVSKNNLGCSTTFARTAGMIEQIFRKRKVSQRPYYQLFPPIIDWQWMLVFGIVIGGLASALLSGDFAWQWIPPFWAGTHGDSLFLRLGVALAGGFCLGFGARWADGCTSGHGISGAMQLSLAAWISAICFFVGGIITAMLVYRMLP